MSVAFINLVCLHFVFQLEIERHPFFESLNWTDLVQKKIPPPFNPNVVGIMAYTVLVDRNVRIYPSSDYS